MNDLISRADAIDAIERIFDRCEEIEAHLPEGDPDRVGYKMYPDWLTVWKYLRQMPSAQPKIIRCKDCSKRYDEEGECPMLFIKSVTYDDDGYIEVDDILHDNTKDEGFCHMGERRTDE